MALDITDQFSQYIHFNRNSILVCSNDLRFDHLDQGKTLIRLLGRTNGLTGDVKIRISYRTNTCATLTGLPLPVTFGAALTCTEKVLFLSKTLV